jgi:hypothetical protein
MIETLMVAAIAAVPGVVAFVWTAFKNHAEKTPAKWDDRFVQGVEEVARRVRDEEKQGDA